MNKKSQKGSETVKRLIVLGNCANQTKDYETTNFVLDLGVVKVLLDAGPGVVKQLFKAGLMNTDIDIVVITHCHGDHVLGFPYFAYSNFRERIQGKTGPSTIPIIALHEVYEGLINMLAFCYPPGKFSNFNIENWATSESKEEVFEFKGIKIRTVPVTHTVPTIGVQFEVDSAKITFSSDTIYDQKLVELAEGSKVLVHTALGTSEIVEIASRIKQATAKEAGKAARDSGAKFLILVHLQPVYREKSNQLIEEARKYFDGKIVVPCELDEIKIE